MAISKVTQNWDTTFQLFRNKENSELKIVEVRHNLLLNILVVKLGQD